jgi:hypothetical protein
VDQQASLRACVADRRMQSARKHQNQATGPDRRGPTRARLVSDGQSWPRKRSIARTTGRSAERAAWMTRGRGNTVTEGFMHDGLGVRRVVRRWNVVCLLAARKAEGDWRLRLADEGGGKHKESGTLRPSRGRWQRLERRARTVGPRRTASQPRCGSGFEHKRQRGLTLEMQTWTFSTNQNVRSCLRSHLSSKTAPMPGLIWPAATTSLSIQTTSRLLPGR